MKFDDIFTKLGDFGRYQKWIYFLTCLPAIPAAFQMLASVFILATPKHRCSIPVMSNDTYRVQSPVHQQFISLYIPRTVQDGEQTYSSCKLFQETDVSRVNRSEVDCSSWVYDKSIFQSTVISEFDLVCEQRDVRAHANMVLMAGLLFGSLSLGLLSDIYGRKRAFLCALLVSIGSGLGVAFSSSIVVFIVLRFFLGATGVGMFLCMFVIGMELVGPSKRTLAGILIELAWCSGLFILGGMAYGIRNWQHLQIAISIPIILMISFFWILPESPRWLISKGRKKEASSILKTLADMNNVILPPTMLSGDFQKEKQEKVWEMFTSPVLVIRSLIIFFNWCVVSMVYYGLGLNVGNLGGDIYVNFTIANFVEAASYVLCILLLDRVGRKILHCSSMLLGGIACLLTIFPVIYGDSSVNWITICFAMIGKLGASAAFAIIYVFSAELFPTVLRNSAMGLSSFSARIGGIASPYIAELGTMIQGDFSKALPLVVFGILSIVAGLLALLLPETLGRKLPESISDAKKFGRKDENEEVCDVPYQTFPSNSDFTSNHQYVSSIDLSSSESEPYKRYFPSNSELASDKDSRILHPGILSYSNRSLNKEKISVNSTSYETDV